MMMCENVDWVAVQKVERDIIYLYHAMTGYGYIMGDWNWDEVYSLPYWDYLHIDGLDSERMEFIRNGCLLCILAMAYSAIEESGNYVVSRVEQCREAVSALQGITEEGTKKLIRAVLLALDAVSRGDELTELDKGVEEHSQWFHKEYVQAYFKKMANVWPDE